MKNIISLIIVIAIYVVVDKGFDFVLVQVGCTDAATEQTAPPQANQNQQTEETAEDGLSFYFRHKAKVKEVLQSGDKTMEQIAKGPSVEDWAKATEEQKIKQIEHYKKCPFALSAKSAMGLTYGNLNAEQVFLMEQVAVMCLRNQIDTYKKGIDDSSEKVKKQTELLGKTLKKDSSIFFATFRATLMSPNRKPGKGESFHSFCNKNPNIEKCGVSKYPFDEIIVQLKDSKGEEEFMSYFREWGNFVRFRKVYFSINEEAKAISISNVLADDDFLSINLD